MIPCSLQKSSELFEIQTKICVQIGPEQPILITNCAKMHIEIFLVLNYFSRFGNRQQL